MLSKDRSGRHRIWNTGLFGGIFGVIFDVFFDTFPDIGSRRVFVMFLSFFGVLGPPLGTLWAHFFGSRISSDF